MNDRPKKPPQSLQWLVFPKVGKPYHEIEDLPRTQKELELEIGRKFLGALSSERNATYTGLRAGPDPTDLLCTDSDGQDIGIQVVEVVDRNSRRIRIMRGSYGGALLSLHADVIWKFTECDFRLVDDGCPPYLPSLGSRDGQLCLASIVRKLEEFAIEAKSLEPNRYFIREIVAAGRKISLILTRREGLQTNFRWEGAVQVDWAQAIASSLILKARKNYSKPGLPFWLLAYSTDTIIAKESPEHLLARQLLSVDRHPFDEAWFLYPFPQTETGHLVQLWPWP